MASERDSQPRTKAHAKLEAAILEYLRGSERGMVPSGEIYGRFLRACSKKALRMSFDECIDRVGSTLERLQRKGRIIIVQNSLMRQSDILLSYDPTMDVF